VAGFRASKRHFMKRGTKSTPTAVLKLHGRFREDRHGGRADTVPPAGEPVKPQMGDVESALWDQVVPDLVRRGLVGESDTAELVSLCELWGLYRKAYEAAKLMPTNKEARCAVTAYWGAFDRVAGKFCLTTADRAGVKLPKDEGKKGLSVRQKAE
jgi:phage terminase small subunit